MFRVQMGKAFTAHESWFFPHCHIFLYQEWINVSRIIIYIFDKNISFFHKQNACRFKFMFAAIYDNYLMNKAYKCIKILGPKCKKLQKIELKLFNFQNLKSVITSR